MDMDDDELREEKRRRKKDVYDYNFKHIKDIDRETLEESYCGMYKDLSFYMDLTSKLMAEADMKLDTFDDEENHLNELRKAVEEMLE